MFKTRLLSGIVLVILLFAIILPGGYLLLGSLWLISLVAFWELSKASGLHTEEKKVNALETMGYLWITVYYGMLALGIAPGTTLLILPLGLMSMLFVYVVTFPKYRAETIMSAFFCMAYAPISLSAVYLTRELVHGAYLVWLIFISSWVCDTCAYCVGRLLGKHKLAPVLSPKKSIEGAIGGVVGSAIVGVLYAVFALARTATFPGMVPAIAVISAIGAILSQVGDLAASGIKRDKQIKDYGNLIPGHGGIMDRFDSVIYVSPVIYILSVVMLGILA